jgi:hypothetical protein
VHTKHSVLQHAATSFTNYNITIKVEVRWGYLLTTTKVRRGEEKRKERKGKEMKREMHKTKMNLLCFTFRNIRLLLSLATNLIIFLTKKIIKERERVSRVVDHHFIPVWQNIQIYSKSLL